MNKAILERIERPRDGKIRRIWLGIGLGVIGLVLISLRLDLNPARLGAGMGHFFYLVGLFFPPSDGGTMLDFLGALAETLAMAFWGTLIGAVLANPLAFAAAANVNKIGWMRFAIRRFFDLVRGVDSLVWALVFVHVVGLGPFAGILALAVMDTAVLGKLFSEAIENADRAEVDGVRSSGSGALVILRYGYLPQLSPIFLSNILYFFEGNVRSASILGVLGAGGIGMQLMDRIRIMNWPEVGFILILLLISIALIDAVSKRLRQHLAGNGPKD
jgi:phosphonate transport system permease protein